MRALEPATRLSFERLGWEMEALPEWALHRSRLSLTRQLLFGTPGKALRFHLAASLWAHGRRQCPIFTLEGNQVWVTIRNLEHGITERDLVLARQLECLYRACHPGSRMPVPRATEAGEPPQPSERPVTSEIDRLAARSVAAARKLLAELALEAPPEG